MGPFAFGRDLAQESKPRPERTPRSARPIPDVRIIDFVDTGYRALLRMWDKRQRGYRAMGYRVKAQRKLGEISEVCSDTMA